MLPHWILILCLLFVDGGRTKHLILNLDMMNSNIAFKYNASVEQLLLEQIHQLWYLGLVSTSVYPIQTSVQVISHLYL